MTVHQERPSPAQCLVSQTFVPHPQADPATGFRGGGQLGAESQPRVPPKLNTPRIYPTIFFRMDPNSLSKKVFWEHFGGRKTWCPPSWVLVGAPGSASDRICRNARHPASKFWVCNSPRCTPSSADPETIWHTSAQYLYSLYIWLKRLLRNEILGDDGFCSSLRSIIVGHPPWPVLNLRRHFTRTVLSGRYL